MKIQKSMADYWGEKKKMDRGSEIRIGFIVAIAFHRALDDAAWTIYGEVRFLEVDSMERKM